jgi:p-hydroxybenzoate 3-monooxygenase
LRATLSSNPQPTPIHAEFVVGCDGAGSIVARETGFPSFEVSHPFRWLAVIAASPPPAPRTVYGLHRRGFSAFMARSPNSTRYYLEVPKDVAHADWPDDRVWQELHARLDAAGHASPVRGDLIERDFLDLRVRVREPMQKGRVFLAGDAAHMVTPAGGKGMNMAILDAIELAAALCEYYGKSRSDDRLARYTSVRMPEIWQYEEFSNWMLGLLHARQLLPGNDSATAEALALGLRRGRLERIMNDPVYAHWFARAYSGS